MKTSQIRNRLPKGVVQKLRENPGGGTHKSAKQYDRKREKQYTRKQVNES